MPSRLVFVLLLAQFLAACSAPQTRALLESARDQPDTVLLDVPFFAQTAYQCGPAALASLLTHRGVATDPAALIDQVFVPALKGTLQPEIAATVRRHGLLAYKPRKDDETALARLLRMIDAGTPVLVLQQLGVGPWPQWHYAVAIGYDLEQQSIVLHSGEHARRAVRLSVFERTWGRASFWSVAALPPAVLPPFAGRDPWVQGAIDLERAGQAKAAYAAYLAALERWPGDEQARLGAGNAAFALGRHREAAHQFHALAAAESDNAAMGWNNLAHALKEMKCTDLSIAAAHRALALAPANAAIADTVRAMQANRVSGTAIAEHPAVCDEWQTLEQK